jgi:hypothetical protein
MTWIIQHKNQVRIGVFALLLIAILGVDYDALRKKRQSQQSENLRYFLSELLKISEIRQLIQELLNKA